MNDDDYDDDDDIISGNKTIGSLFCALTFMRVP